MPLDSVVLAAHAKVLAALSGEQDVMTGYVTGPGGRPLPCRLTTEPGSWRACCSDTPGSRRTCCAHRDFPVDALTRELGWPSRRSRP